MAVLLTGTTNAPHVEAVVEHFRQFLTSQRLSLNDLWVAHQGERPLAASLLLPAAGRTGMLFVSPTPFPPAAEALGLLLATQLATLRNDQAALPAEQRFQLLQCLLDPSQIAESHHLQAQGFEPLARLVYMQRTAAPVDPPPPPTATLRNGRPLDRTPWSEAIAPRFGQAIEASYQDTRDCPALVGRRSIADILAGHRGTGPFDPALWTLHEYEGRPAAVCLINPTPAGDGHELVYLGVAPPFRGQGVARQLLTHALHHLATRPAPRLLLAVDQANAPALALYRTLGFSPTLRKQALILSINQENK